MTYCVGLRLESGLVFMSDTRTNAGVDNVSTFRKMHTWTVPGERSITLLSSGNLATTQALVSMLDERSKAPAERHPSILVAPSIFQVARLVGDTLREIIRTYADNGQSDDGKFSASVIVGGQIKGGEPRLFMVYAEGNFIEASNDTPFLQIGETKYGRPILVRAYDPTMNFADAIKLLLVSFDSTIKANLSVGLPLDYLVLPKDALNPLHAGRIEVTDAYYEMISTGWGRALKSAFDVLPAFDLTR
jgi:putative proteasome-type protease